MKNLRDTLGHVLNPVENFDRNIEESTIEDHVAAGAIRDYLYRRIENFTYAAVKDAMIGQLFGLGIYKSKE